MKLGGIGFLGRAKFYQESFMKISKGNSSVSVLGAVVSVAVLMCCVIGGEKGKPETNNVVNFPASAVIVVADGVSPPPVPPPPRG